MNVLIVCHGNICRSPVFAKLLENKSLPNVAIRQASLKSYNDDSWAPGRASKKIREKANELFNISLEDHRSRKLQLEDLEWCDYCVYFDNGNLKRLISIVDIDSRYKLINAGELIGLKRIRDPNFLSKDSEELVCILHQIKDSVDRFAEVLYHD